MLQDLEGQGRVARSVEFLVIGAGTVGLPTACMLAERTGKSVVCLESGGAEQRADTHPLNEVVQLAEVYSGAASGRFRCLGGTSTRWGGALAPFLDADTIGAGWPLHSSELMDAVRDVERLFGLEPGSYTDPDFPIDTGPYVNRLAKWPAFAKRNVATLLAERMRRDPGLELWLNAHVVGIDAASETVTVRARSAQGDEIEVRARHLIIAAGAIETTRLALLIDRWHDGAISRISPDLGRYFADHVSAPVAELIPESARVFNRIFGFRFGAQGSMRNIRFEMAPQAPERAQLPPHFVHIGFTTEAPGGFDALRDLFRSLQRRRVPSPKVIWRLLRAAPWLARAVWWRFVLRRLLFPAGARLTVHVVIEQIASAAHRIGLSVERTDSFGLPLAEIDWRVEAEDLGNLRACAERFAQVWRTTGLSRLAQWHSTADASGLDNPEGIFHPTGSTRMGATPELGVVDRDLQLFALPRIQLLSTSVLPTGGGSNPTMMVLALAMRLVAQHEERIRGEQEA